MSKRPNAGQALREAKSKAWAALAEFEKAVGGRDKLVETLALAPEDPVQQKLLAVLTDPSRQTDSLARVVADVGVHANEVLQLFRDGNFARAFAESQQVLAERMPAVVRDVAEKAADHLKPCECRLTAVGFVGPVDPECKTCKGTGVRFQKGSLPHAELVLEAAELLKRGQGVHVQVQQNVGVQMGDGFFEKLIKGTDDVALGIGEVLDAEVVE